MATLPQGSILKSGVQYTEQPTKTFIIDWSSRQITGMDDGLIAMRQAVDIILQNERFQWQIYSSNFGSELEDLIGEEYDYIVGDLPRRIEEAFSTDRRILSVENFNFVMQGSDRLVCSFDVITVFGVIGEEVIL